MLDRSFLSSDLFLLTLTVGLYCLGRLVYRRLRMPLLHPVLLTFVAVIVFLKCTEIDYPRYQQATGALNFALGMSVVALGYLLYEQVERLRGSLLPVGVATLAGCVVGVLSVVYIAMAFGTERQILNSIAPKSVTVPIAVSVAGPLGGNVSVTTADPGVISGSVDAVHAVDENIAVLCGAGVKTGEDVRTALDLGAKGVLVASGVVKASKPEEALRDLIKYI